MGDGLLSLNWNNHGATFCHTLASLRAKDKYTDVTVSCGGKFYQVHKLVLSTCSEYFEKIFEHTPCKHPVIVLRDVQCDELESLLNYMYKGVVSVAQSDLSRLIKVAELLQIKGLAVPDEPPSCSKVGSSKRTNDDRLSPRSNADSSSPYPKRRRRRESDNYQASTSASSAAAAAPQQRNEEPQESTWAEDQDSRVVDDRLHDTTATQERIHSPVTVNVDESLVKEEILDDQSHSDMGESDYCGLGDTSGDGSQDTGGLMIPKFDDQPVSDSAVALPDAVVEALAGPSGMQGWADGGDMTRRMALGEGFVGNESQDMSASVGLPPQPSGQQRQMMELALASWETEGYEDDSKKHRCQYCNYSTNKKYNLKTHIRIHTGEKPFQCPYCPSKFSDRTCQRRHERIHTGEKPFQCPFCPLKFSQRISQRIHLQKHTGEKPFHCEYCPYQASLKATLRNHIYRLHANEMGLVGGGNPADYLTMQVQMPPVDPVEPTDQLSLSSQNIS